jgi:hypothetical protein
MTVPMLRNIRKRDRNRPAWDWCEEAFSVSCGRFPTADGVTLVFAPDLDVDGRYSVADRTVFLNVNILDDKLVTQHVFCHEFGHGLYFDGATQQLLLNEIGRDNARLIQAEADGNTEEEEETVVELFAQMLYPWSNHRLAEFGGPDIRRLFEFPGVDRTDEFRGG